MGGLSLQKRIAAQILKVGITKVWIDPEHREDIKNAITKADIRKAISHGYIKAKKGKLEYPKEMKKKKKTIGSRKGRKHSRYDKKRKWINTIRPLRRMLKELKTSNNIDQKMYRETYKLLKGGTFRSRAHLKLYLQQKGVKL